MARQVPEGLKPYQWKPGQSGNPAGAKKGVLGGRSAALRELDVMLAKAENLQVLREALEKDFRKNPMRFFKDVVMPLLPKQAVSQLNSGDRVIEWRGLLTVGGPGNDDGMGVGDATGCGRCARAFSPLEELGAAGVPAEKSECALPAPAPLFGGG